MRIRKLGRYGIAAAALTALLPSSASAAPGCSKSAAREAIVASPEAQAAIRRTGNVEAAQDVFAVYGVARVQCRDLTRDGRREMGVLLRCCTVSSYSPFLIFQRSGEAWTLRFAKSKMTIFKVTARGRSFVLKEPDYARTDPNCCPSRYRYFRIRHARGEFRMKRIRRRTAAASAARSTVVGRGTDPGVAIDAAGTAHLAYNAQFEEVGPGEPLLYCAWPRGARRCTPRAIVSDGESPSSQPALVRAGPAPGEVTIVSRREGGAHVFRSLDGGASFAGPVLIGDGRWFDGAFGPGGQLALSFRNLGYIEYYHRSLTGPSNASGQADLNRGHAIQSEVGFAGTRPVLVSGAFVPRIAVSSWSGQGDVHDPATWLGPFKIARSNHFALAGGRRGLFLAHDRPAGSDRRVVVRRFRARRFGPPRQVPVSRFGRPGVINLGLGQDPAGRLLVAYYNSYEDVIEVSASRNGRRWTRARVAATGVDLPDDIQVALGPGGRGFVVWDENFGDDIHAIRVNAGGLLRRPTSRRRSAITGRRSTARPAARTPARRRSPTRNR